jgi:Kae1-associated kinase Bud32
MSIKVSLKYTNQTIKLQLYFINWERKITRNIFESNKVVVKKTKSFTNLRHFILIFCFTLLSIFSGNPSCPPEIGQRIVENESFEFRKKLKLMGINTPKLFSISYDEIIEEYIKGGNLYFYFHTENTNDLAFQAGKITGLLHKNGFVFIDNKCQNFLVDKNKVIRIDLGFIQKSESIFAQSMDVGSFLASILDLKPQVYRKVAKEFLSGYLQITHNQIPYLSIILRNILALGFVYSHDNMIKNMLNKRMA